MGIPKAVKLKGGRGSDTGYDRDVLQPFGHILAQVTQLATAFGAVGGQFAPPAEYGPGSVSALACWRCENRPLSRCFEKRHAPYPSHQMILIRSPCRPLEHKHMTTERVLLRRLLGLSRQRRKALAQVIHSFGLALSG